MEEYKLREKFVNIYILYKYIKTIKCKDSARCDYEGTCKNRAFVEVFPYTHGDGKNPYIFKSWSCLCLKHFVICLLRGDTFFWGSIENTDSIEEQDEND